MACFKLFISFRSAPLSTEEAITSMPPGRKSKQQGQRLPKSGALPSKRSISSKGQNPPEQQQFEGGAEPKQSYSTRKTRKDFTKPEAGPSLARTRTRRGTTEAALLPSLESDRAIRKQVRQRREDIIPSVEQVERRSVPERTPSRSESEGLPQDLVTRLVNRATSLLQTVQWVRKAKDIPGPLDEAQQLLEDLKLLLPLSSEKSLAMSEGAKTVKLTESQKAQILADSYVERVATAGYADNKVDADIITNVIAFKSAQIKPSTPKKESGWSSDLVKCRNSHEAVYQTILLAKTIDRRNFKEMETRLDYTACFMWKSAAPPIKEDAIRYLWAPTPDLTVGFQPKLFFENQGQPMTRLPEKLKCRILPENPRNSDHGRAFPFLMLEAKGASSPLDGGGASNQSLNDGCQALYNIWQFMQGDEIREREFFDHVRVFTAGGHGRAFWLRIHRADKMGNLLNYQFDDIQDLTGPDYTQSRVQSLVRNVMTWALNTLLPLLQKAVKAACDSKGPVVKYPSDTAQGGRKVRGSSTAGRMTPREGSAQDKEVQDQTTGKRPSPPKTDARPSKRNKRRGTQSGNINPSSPSSHNASSSGDLEDDHE